MIQTSIVIPVFNKWDLTRNCLKSLAATVDPATTEVIVVDNASSDPTQAGCAFLGKKLFGSSFVYERNEVNRNFAGASNQGARLAKGDWLLFLNNDTILTPNWLEPLHADFREHPQVAATGPVLVYEAQGPFGHAVQHLGVSINPQKKVNHLYAGIPANSPLARKRRFFQAITAACMLMPKKLFLEAGQFDEGFINGFEDLDLCARLAHGGWRTTVNPLSTVIHLESRTPGRHAFEAENSRRLLEGNYKFLKPDFETFLAADGLELGITDWLDWRIKMLDTDMLDAASQKEGMEAIAEKVVENPFWLKGWQMLLERETDVERRLLLREQAISLFHEPEIMLENCLDAIRKGDQTALARNAAQLKKYLIPPMDYLKAAFYLYEYCKQEPAATHLAGLFGSWADKYKEFLEEVYSPLNERVKAINLF